MEEKQLGSVEQWGMSCQSSWDCEPRGAGSDRVNVKDMVRQGYHRPHVTATAVGRPSFLNAPISLHSAQRQHYADGRVTSQLASATRSKGPLPSGKAPHRNLTSLCLTEQHDMKACG